MSYTYADSIRAHAPILAQHLERYEVALMEAALSGHLILIEVQWDGQTQYAMGTSCFDGHTTDPMKAMNFGEFQNFNEMWSALFAIYIPERGGAKSGIRSTVPGKIAVFNPPTTSHAYSLTHFENAPEVQDPYAGLERL